MALLDGALGAALGAAFAPLCQDGVLRKQAGASVPGDMPARIMVAGLSDVARAASGLPASAVTITMLAASLAAEPDLDDLVVTGGRIYRVLRRELDPAGAAWRLAAVPA